MTSFLAITWAIRPNIGDSSGALFVANILAEIILGLSTSAAREPVLTPSLCNEERCLFGDVLHCKRSSRE